MDSFGANQASPFIWPDMEATGGTWAEECGDLIFIYTDGWECDKQALSSKPS